MQGLVSVWQNNHPALCTDLQYFILYTSNNHKIKRGKVATYRCMSARKNFSSHDSTAYLIQILLCISFTISPLMIEHTTSWPA